MKIPFLDLTYQTEAVADCFARDSSRLVRENRFIGGEPVEAFEEAFAGYCGVRHCVGLNSGTDALRLALIASGVEPRNEVITSPFTFIANAECISQVGSLVLADVDGDTFNLSVDSVSQAVTARTRVVMPVHIFGLPADMEGLGQIAERSNLQIVEDACQAHGASIRGRRVGSFGLAAAFSFYPTKNLGAFGDAGALTTNDSRLAERVRLLRNHGQVASYEHAEEGFNSRLDALQAAVLRLKLKQLPEWTAIRRSLASLYRDQLADVEEVRFQHEPEGFEHSYHLLAARVRQRDQLMRRLQAQGITTRVIYPIPTHLQQAYQHLGHREGDFPNCEKVCREVLCFPFYPGLTESMVERVTQAIKDFYAG